MSSPNDPSHTRTLKAHPSASLASNLTRFVILTSALALFFTGPKSHARCMMSAEEGAPLPQGEVIADLGGMGGSQGGGYSAGGRLGLTGGRELQLRVGGCQRELQDPNDPDGQVDLWGNGLSLGLKQGLLTPRETGSLELSASLHANLLSATDSKERGDAYSSLGFTPSLLLSYPFSITADREGFITLILGGNAQFVDQNRQDSQFELLPTVGLSGGVEVLPLLSLRGTLNWQDDGVYGGAFIAYRF